MSTTKDGDYYHVLADLAGELNICMYVYRDVSREVHVYLRTPGKIRTTAPL